MTAPLTAVTIIAWREIIRFARQPARIAAAVGTPGLIWLLLASGLTRAVRPESLPAHGYTAFLLPGMMSLVAVFSSIFAAISLIEDRNEGWLQAVLVAPTRRSFVALGKLLGGAALAWGQALPLLLLFPLAAPGTTVAALLQSALALALTSLGVTALALALAWRSETVAGFHAVMNLVLMPLWLLSSAMFPLTGAVAWLTWLMRANPLTWCAEAIRAPLTGSSSLPALPLTLAFAALAIAFALITMSRPPRHWS